MKTVFSLNVTAHKKNNKQVITLQEKSLLFKLISKSDGVYDFHDTTSNKFIQLFS